MILTVQILHLARLAATLQEQTVYYHNIILHLNESIYKTKNKTIKIVWTIN